MAQDRQESCKLRHSMSGRFPVLYIAEKDPSEALLSCGILAYLVEALPQASFTVVGSPQSAPLFADLPRLSRLITMQGQGRLDWVGLWNQVRATRWGLVVDLRGSALSGKLKRKHRAVRSAAIDPTRHAAEQAAAILALEEVPPPRLFLSDATREKADALLPPSERPLVVLAPGHPWIGGQWPGGRYAQAIEPLLMPDGRLAGARVALIGPAVDRDTVNAVRSVVPVNRLIELQGEMEPLVCAAVLARASLYVGPDSIWTHLAVAAGAPTVGLFGPTDERVRGPWLGQSVRGPRSLEEFHKLDPRGDQALAHLHDITPERVTQAALKLLSQPSA